MSIDAIPPFEPRFRMPLIGPPPSDYASDAATYYAEAQSQSGIVVTTVAVEPEVILPPTSPSGASAMRVVLGQPDAVFQYTPGSGPAGPPPSPWRTLFALMGGELTYVPSTAVGGLGPHLPAPYDSMSPAFSPSASPGLLTAQWGTLVLKLWGGDVLKMQTEMSSGSACGAIHYVGVDQASLAAAAEPIAKAIHPKDRFDAASAAGRTPALRKTLEAIVSTPYLQAPSYGQLIADLIAQFVAGNTSLLVPGGAAVGKTVLVDPGGGSAAAGAVELWAIDAAPVPAFSDLVSILSAGASIP